MTPAHQRVSKLQETEPQNNIVSKSGSTMIIRGCLRLQLPRVAAKRAFRTFAQPAKTTRRYSTANAPPMASSTPQSQVSMLATITTDLDKIAPRFEIQPDQITIIQSPADFYETLKVGQLYSFFCCYSLRSHATTLFLLQYRAMSSNCCPCDYISHIVLYLVEYSRRYYCCLSLIHMM